MEQFLCGICPRRFSRNTLIRHIIQHSEHRLNHKHFLWCSLCSPSSLHLDVHAYDKQSNGHEDYVSGSGESDDNFVNGYSSNPVFDTYRFNAAARPVYDNCTYSANGEIYVFSNGTCYRADTLGQDYARYQNYYDGNDILPYPNESGYSDPSLQNNFSALNDPLNFGDLTNNSYLNPLINGEPLVCPINAEIRSEDATQAQSLPEIANAEIPCSGQSTSTEPLPEPVHTEIPCRGLSTSIEPLPEPVHVDFLLQGISASLEPLPDSLQAEISCRGQSASTEPPEPGYGEIPCREQTSIEPLPEHVHAEIPCRGQSTSIEPLPEPLHAEIPCTGQSASTEPPETGHGEIPCRGQSTSIEPLPDTAHIQIPCAGQALSVESRLEATDSESHLSKSPDDEFNANVSRSSCRQKGLNDNTFAGTLNPSGRRVGRGGSGHRAFHDRRVGQGGSGHRAGHGRRLSHDSSSRRIAFRANSESGSCNTQENSRISSVSPTYSNRNLSYSAALQRGLSNRR